MPRKKREKVIVGREFVDFKPAKQNIKRELYQREVYIPKKGEEIVLKESKRLLLENMEIMTEKYNFRYNKKTVNINQILTVLYYKAKRLNAYSIMFQFLADGEAKHRGAYVEYKFKKDEESLKGLKKFIKHFQEQIYEDVDWGRASDIAVSQYYRDLNTTDFWIKRIIPARGGNHDKHDRKTKSTFYKCYTAYDAPNNDCLFYCIKKTLNLPIQSKTIRAQSGILHENDISIDEIESIENKLNIKINIYSDYAYLDCHFVNGNHMCKTVYEKLYESKLTDDNLKIVNCLLKDNHYSFIEEFIPVACFIRDGKIKPNEEYTHYLFYDIETVYEPEEFYNFKPYSVAWTIYNIKDKTAIDYFKYGWSCLDTFIKVLYEARTTEKYLIVGYNSSRFDNYLLIERLMEHNLPVKSLLIANNSILGLTIKNHKFFDLNRYLLGSLKENCIQFKKQFLNNRLKVDGFDHDKIQTLFNNKQFDIYFSGSENMKKLKEYNCMDTGCLMDLFLTFRETMFEIGLDDINDYCTIGQQGYQNMINKYFQNTGFKFTANFPRLKQYEEDEFIRNCLTAGRVQCFRTGDLNFQEELKMVDVCSLYPFVMNTFYFPKGEKYYYFNPENMKYDHDKLGIYCIEYQCPINELNILPFRSTSSEIALDWDSKDKFITGATNLEIELCIRFNHYYKIIFGIVFEEMEYAPFRYYIYNIFEQKRLEDLKINKNEAKRQTTKFAINAISGKVIQRNFEDSTQILNTFKNVNKKWVKVDNSNIINQYKKYTIEELGNKIFIKGKLKKEFRYKDTAKPCYLGIFIYSYARSYMYNIIHDLHTRLYMDTDSLLMENSDYVKLKNMTGGFSIFNMSFKYNDLVVSPTNPKILGKLEEECPEASFKCQLIQAKSYAIISNIPGKSKFRFKGVNKRWSILDPDQSEKIKELLKDPALDSELIEYAKLLPKITDGEIQFKRLFNLKLENYEKTKKMKLVKLYAFQFQRVNNFNPVKNRATYIIQMIKHIKEV